MSTSQVPGSSIETGCFIEILGLVERTVEVADGRLLAVEEAGDPLGWPVLVHNGTPCSRRLYSPNVEDARRRGIRLISYDRPGYGGSTPMPGRAVADCALDVRAICAALGINRLVMWGISGGGPHVLACAALLPDLVLAAAALASLAPYDAEGLDWFAGMGEENAADYRLILRDEPAARAKLEADRQLALSTSPPELAALLGTLLSPVDAGVLDGEMTAYLSAVDHDGLAPGSQGWWDDARAFVTPWGIEPRTISIPVLVVHGRHDQFSPFAHGAWLAAHIPQAEAWLLDNDGHLTLCATRVGAVHDWLLQHE